MENSSTVTATLFDTHCHLTLEDDINTILAVAKDNGVEWLLLAGAPIVQCTELLHKVKAYKTIYTALGVHPHEADVFDGDMQPIEALAGDEQVKAIGEIGLDYHYTYSKKTVQRRVFRQFLEFATTSNKPVIIHNRQATDDCYRMLNDHLPSQYPFVLHCYTESVQWVERFIEMGGWISFTGILTFPNAEGVRESLQCVPLNRLMFETDSPYLAPVPFRGQKNQPANLRCIVEYAARCLKMPFDQLAAISTRNAFRFFNILDKA